MQQSDQSVGVKIRQIERVYNSKPEGESLPACKVFVTRASKHCTEWCLCSSLLAILHLRSGRSRLLSLAVRRLSTISDDALRFASLFCQFVPDRRPVPDWTGLLPDGVRPKI